MLPLGAVGESGDSICVAAAAPGGLVGHAGQPLLPMLAISMPISMVSWNCQALSQHSSHSQHRARAKHRELLRLAARFDAVALQEAHGHEGDMHRLAAELPQHFIVGTFHERAAGGGCMMLINKGKLSGVDVVHHVVADTRVHDIEFLLLEFA